MKIALVALHFAEYASRLAVALAERHEVLLILSAANADAELSKELREELEAGVNVRYLELRRRHDPRIVGTSARMNALLERFSPDLLHVQEFAPILGGWTILRNRRRMPVVMTIHDPVFHSGEMANSNWEWRMQVWFRCKADRLIVHGPNSRTKLEDVDACLNAKADIIPHGVLGRDDFDADIGVCEPATFLFFGRVQAYKGLKYCLDAAAILNRRGRNIRLIIAGTGDDLDRHRETIAASPWVELIDRYVGPEELPGLMGRATAVLLPYTDATQSGVGAMALAYARPVIASRVGDLPAVVRHEQNGLTVPPRNALALADAMDRLVLDPQLRDSLAAGALEFARDHLAWPRIAALTCEVYRRACREQRQTDMQQDADAT